MDRTVRAMEREIRTSPHAGRPSKTVFFGGGTPTFLQASHLESLLRAVVETHPLVDGAEVTSEANPGTVDIPKFRDMRRMGFNRISLGAQSFDSGDLLRLGRVHEPTHIGRAVDAARSAGFDNLNLDLMFALPGQSARGWKSNLDLAVRLEPEHLSLYCLTIEPNTRYYRLHLRGALDLPDDESQVAMYDDACQVMERHGYGQYEISNFAKPGRECRHNLCYWRGEEYLGYGPGAVGRVGDTRETRIKHPDHYCEAVEQGRSLACDTDTVDATALRLERIMLGVRLNEGLSTSEVALDVGILDRLRGRGWIDDDHQRVRLTPQGRHFCTEVALALI